MNRLLVQVVRLPVRLAVHCTCTGETLVDQSVDHSFYFVYL